MTAPRSLVTLWQDGTNADRSWFSRNFLPRLNPAENFTLINVSKETGTWDLSYADEVASANPGAAMTVRPFAENENLQWESTEPEKWIVDAKAKLQGRRYRVTLGCEPDFHGQKLTDFLAWLVKLMPFAVKHNQPVSIGGWQPQHIKAFTNDADDLFKGKWKTYVQQLGEVGPIFRQAWHTYTGPWAPAGTFDDSYLREIADKPELLRDPKTWATWAQLTAKTDLQRWRTRHLFRHLWFNYYAEDNGWKRHDYSIEESIYDYYGNEDDLKHTWQRFKDITGIDEVSGINEIQKWIEWKNPYQPWKKTVAEQLIWYGNLLANDPNCKSWALYCVSGQLGEDRQPYNFGAHRDLLEMLVGKNPVRVPTSPVTTPPVTQPPVTTPPTPPPAEQPPEEDEPPTEQPPQLPTWRDAFTVDELAEVFAAMELNPNGLTAKLGKALMWRERL